MPIRTDRGHAAALRRFWSWPLHTPTRFLSAITGTGLLITAVACSATALTGPDPEPAPPTPQTSLTSAPTTDATTTEPTSSAAPSTSAPTSTGNSTQSPSSQPQPGKTSDGPRGAVTTATEFMRSWIRPSAGVGAQEWLATVRPYVMPEYQRNLASIDPANIPATELTGKPKRGKTTKGLVEVDVPTDADTIRVTVIAQPDGRWLVRTWEPTE